MRTRLLFLVFAAGMCAFGQGYTYDVTGLPYASSTWAANGAVDYDYSSGIDFYEDAGSFIYLPAVSLEINPATNQPYPSASSNDYEVSMAMPWVSSTVIEFLRASSNAMRSTNSATGSFISVEMTGYSLVVNQCVNGSLTQLGSTTVPYPGAAATLRSVIWGTTLWVFYANQLVYTNTGIPLTYGQPGIGGFLPNSNYSEYDATDITSVSIGHHDVVAPATPNHSSLRSSILPNSASLAWEGVADDPVGIGLYRYNISRNGSALTYISGTPVLTDSTVQPATSYTYTITAVDFHGNATPAVNYSITTPPATDVDPRRTGIYTTGSYWGGGGEQIDTLGGNLNFSIPLVKPMGRTGWTVPIGLSYNSQNWRQDGGVNWSLGVDTGYGYGWTLQIGSITPYYAGWTSGVDHYIYTDGSGAAYRLDQNNSGIWSSLQGIYVWFDSTTNKLHFKDGKFWVMGCTSSGGEQDAGTMYPTLLEDPNGNQVIVTYQAAVGFPTTVTNTSARIVTIEDARAANLGGYPVVHYVSYSFSYTTGPIPHLSSVANSMNSGETFPSFSYATGVPLAPPFGSDPNYNGVTTTHLTNVVVPAAGPTTSAYPAAGQYTFAYDSAGAAELTQVTFPWGGHLRWVYSNATYAGSRFMREVTSRYLAADAAGAVEWGPYPFTHSDSGGIQTVHTDTTLADASGVGAKKWTFNTSGAAWQIGLTSQFLQLASVNGTVMTQDTYTWSQTGGSTAVPKIGSEPYISQKVHVMDPGSSNAQSAQSSQTVDAYGNVLTVNVYPFNNTSSPLQAFTSTYLNSGYASNYILDRLLTTTLTVGGVVKTPVQNLYDNAGYNSQPSYSPCTGSLYFMGAPTFREIDTSAPAGTYGRGLPTQSTTPVKSTCMQFDGFGNVSSAAGSDGTSLSIPAGSATNYAAPASLTTESYNYSAGYSSWLGLTQTTGANGEQVATTYDGYGRPGGSVTAYGGSTYYQYPDTGAGPTLLPTYQRTQLFGLTGMTYKLLDGVGRTIQTKVVDSVAGPQSYTSMQYAPCACSPMGKLQATSQPVAIANGSSIPSAQWPSLVTGGTLAWTTYTYDGIGRTLTVTQPDGTSVTTYSYSGNQTKVTDPAGNWKTFTNDVLGNLISVTEPDPANPGGTVTTTYSYDWMNHLATSTMTRGATTQTRTFVYSDAGLLTSSTNPESGTTTYTYGWNLLTSKVDADGQGTYYVYNTARQITGIYYSRGGVADPCQTVNYTYGSDPTVYSYGRIVSITYGTLSQVCLPNPVNQPTQYTENYTYTVAGDVATKSFLMSRGSPDYNGETPLGGAQPVSYTYDAFGRVNGLQYEGYDPFNSRSYPPDSWPPSTVNLAYGFDSMGRPVSMTEASPPGYSPVSWVQGVTYDAANRMTSMQYPQYSSVFDYMTESKTYNVNGQLATMTWTPGVSGQGAPSGTITYGYTGSGHTGNNGQVVQAVDGVSGETISYQYDVLKRLTQASSTPTSGSTPAAWTQGYTYDGFGNLTGKGSTAIPVNSATNQLMNSTGVLSNVSYDANGNLLSVTNAGASGLTMTYDEANRVASATVGSSGTEYYGYDPSNHRIYKRAANGVEEWTLYGARGEKLGTFGWWQQCTDPDDPTDCWWEVYTKTTNIWFGGKLLWSGTGATNTSGPDFTDRLGTNRGSGARFYPYGDEITGTSSDRVKFATYTRSSFTGMDYADQRFYASSYGNFTTPDPSMENVDYTNPGSWNAYAYTNGDPINGNDPTGLQTCGQTPIVGGAFNGQTVSQVFTGTSGNDLLAQEIWHEGGTIYSSDLTSQASTSAYAQDLAAIGTAILNQWDVDDGRLKVYQNGRAVCPLGQCLDRSLAQIIETIATYSSGGQMVSVFNSSGQMQGPAAATLSGILGTNINSGPLVLDSSGQYVNQGCEGVLASLVTGSGLLGGTTPRVSPNGLTLLFWNQASATSTTTFPGNVGYTGWRDARTRGETFWGLSSTAPPPIRRPPPRRPR